jgi:hypothetical protein
MKTKSIQFLLLVGIMKLLTELREIGIANKGMLLCLTEISLKATR